MTDFDVPNKANCPACKKLLAITKSNTLPRHGNNNQVLCEGSWCQVKFRYVVEEVSEIPLGVETGTHLLFGRRMSFGDEPTTHRLPSTKRCVMKPLDAGIGFSGHYYNFNGEKVQ